ncbi:Sporulation protein ykvU [Mycobacteroides abscessus subsp. abscessus]|nr:Sporulation protein ykvU [Mycobacteroides abscessus subsp. abscessus]
MQAGLSQEMALGQFGMLTGIAMAIGFFPAFIAHSFLIMLIPAVSKAQARSETGVLIGLLKQVMLITAIYGIPAAAAIYLLLTFMHYLTICKRIGITFWTLKADRPGIL